MFSEYPLTCIFFKYRINTENGGFKPDIYPTYLIVEEVSKTIEIINSRDVYVYIP